MPEKREKEKAEKTYSLRIQLAPLHPAIHRVPFGPRAVNHPVHDHVRHVHPLRAKLARQGLGERPRGELAGGERPEARRPAQGGGGARDEQGGRVRWGRGGGGGGGEEEGEGGFGEVVEASAVGELVREVSK